MGTGTNTFDASRPGEEVQSPEWAEYCAWYKVCCARPRSGAHVALSFHVLAVASEHSAPKEADQALTNTAIFAGPCGF